MTKPLVYVSQNTTHSLSLRRFSLIQFSNKSLPAISSNCILPKFNRLLAHLETFQDHTYVTAFQHIPTNLLFNYHPIILCYIQ